MNIIDAFEYKTIDMRWTSTDITRHPAHCYGDLATFRLDTALRREGSNDGPLSSQELWAVLILSNGALFFGYPVFRTLDNATNFIYAVNMLTNSWARADIHEFRRIKSAVNAAREQQDGILLGPLLASEPDWQKYTEKAGARLDLNGYRPDA